MPDVSNVLGINPKDSAAGPDLRTVWSAWPASIQGGLEAASGPGALPLGSQRRRGMWPRVVRKDEFN